MTVILPRRRRNHYNSGGTELKNITLELIEPDRNPSTWREFLDAKGEGIHHVAFEIKGMDEKTALLENF
ncbi:MAG: hypothetical protein A2Y69_08870 [Candidatus Aminicenantes bacterium RBG_13_59_9]|jgi:4-hydroxyphenylpyruvate dioxygenase-like putative hemolysin|nr:MAG: hypothetical protein A2Y69_08870 [Candidatus Aminicenantes bacterium RBG_13_59_9]